MSTDLTHFRAELDRLQKANAHLRERADHMHVLIVQQRDELARLHDDLSYEVAENHKVWEAVIAMATHVDAASAEIDRLVDLPSVKSGTEPDTTMRGLKKVQNSLYTAGNAATAALQGDIKEI